MAAEYLGEIYEVGPGGPRDSPITCELYHQAIDGGHMCTSRNLAGMYKSGDGVARDSV